MNLKKNVYEEKELFYSNNSLEFEFLWLFPGEVWIVSSEVSIAAGLGENWSCQSEGFDDHSWL